MTEKRKRRKHMNDVNDEYLWKPTTEELTVANYLLKKLPHKEGKLCNMIVRVFIAMEAVQLLMDSPWAQSSHKNDSSKNLKPYLFPSQSAAVGFMHGLLQKQFFYRAIKMKKKVSSKTKDEGKTKVKVKKTTEGKTVSKDESATETKETVVSNALSNKGHMDGVGNGVVHKTKSSSSMNKPIRIEMADEQLFLIDDPQTVYVWIHEPPPSLFNWLAGAALLIGIILCCLFPIWPSQLRLGAYYLMVVASALLGLLLGVALLRLCLYIIVWLLTIGSYNFWLFPNYLEDCGFFESFQPIYSLIYTEIGNRKNDQTKPTSSTDMNKDF